MENYLAEFLTIAAIHMVAVASPGPDFAIVVKQSVNHGRRTAVITGLGIGVGILIHVAYSLLGIGVLVASSVVAFTVMKILGAAYLVYVGFQALRAKAKTGDSLEAELNKGDETPIPSAAKAFGIGFMTNGLNPKVTLFFLSLFTALISPETPLMIQGAYGLYMAIATAVWFTFVAYVFSTQKVRRGFQRFGHWFDRAMGAALMALGIKLAFASQS